MVAGQKHKLLFTGCCRSGTRYAAQLMIAGGLRCGHEKAFTRQAVCDWGDMQAESSSFALRAVESGMTTECFVVQLVRNPLEVVRSVCGLGIFNDAVPQRHVEYVPWIAANCPQSFRPGDSPLTRATIYWALVNQRAENQTMSRLRVEDITELHLSDISNITGLAIDPTAIHRVRRDINRRPSKSDNEPSWSDMITSVKDPIRSHLERMIERYGYAPPTERPPHAPEQEEVVRQVA